MLGRNTMCAAIGLAAAAAMLMAGVVWAAIPKKVNYQVKLTDSVTGAPLAGVHNMTFRLYESATGGSALWSEDMPVTADSGGVAAVVLGEINPIELSFAGPVWLEIDVDGETLLPRRQLVTVPYAFNAARVNGLDAGTTPLPNTLYPLDSGGKVPLDVLPDGMTPGAHAATHNAGGSDPITVTSAVIQDGTILSGDIADNTIPATKIVPDVVSSVEGVSNDGGNIDLVAGSNISISHDNTAKTITISATGLPAGDITTVSAGTGLDGGGTSGDVTLSVEVPLSLSASVAAGGVVAGSNSSTGAGVSGTNTGTGNSGYLGVTGSGVYGTGSARGVEGYSSAGTGVRGYSDGEYGIYGESGKLNGTGVEGLANGIGSTCGVRGRSQDGTGVEGKSTSWYGVYGHSRSSVAVKAMTDSGAAAAMEGLTYGEGGMGVHGTADVGQSAIGVYGQSTQGIGVKGQSSFATGVFGYSSEETAVYGQSYGPIALEGWTGYNGGTGVQGTADVGSSAYGVAGYTSQGIGVYGHAEDGGGMYGYSHGGNAGAKGKSDGLNCNGLIGQADNGPYAYGVWGLSTSGYAGYFTGNVHVGGTLSKSAGGFKIDHPLDPENKYLNHAFVESPDMMNIYNGNIVLDGSGEAVVELPGYFDALNQDVRYQLTPVGAPAPNLYIAQKVSGNRFRIAGGAPGLEVSWQVTGVRKDAYAQAHRIEPEVPKEPENRGKYLNPSEFGESQERGITWEKIQAQQELNAAESPVRGENR